MTKNGESEKKIDLKFILTTIIESWWSFDGKKQHKKYNNKSKEPNKTMENLIYINGDENM